MSFFPSRCNLIFYYIILYIIYYELTSSFYMHTVFIVKYLNERILTYYSKYIIETVERTHADVVFKSSRTSGLRRKS